MKLSKIIIFMFFILCCLYITNRIVSSNVCDISVKVDQSKILKGGRGLFATKDYNKGDTIEVCPTITVGDIPNKNIMSSYFFKGNKQQNFNPTKDSLIAFGYCSLINHSDTKQNCSWNVSKDNKTITMYATKEINKGYEIYTDYGASYNWDNV